MSKKEWVDYQEYIKSDAWRIRAAEAKRVADYRCQVCNSGDSVLHAHHRTYERLGCELALDITVLCDECHRLFHDYQKMKKESKDDNNFSLEAIQIEAQGDGMFEGMQMARSYLAKNLAIPKEAADLLTIYNLNSYVNNHGSDFLEIGKLIVGAFHGGFTGGYLFFMEERNELD